ncbi:MAG: right-handed parallel beta-helix repeat-containing protein [Promethearchaeota archaeon]
MKMEQKALGAIVAVVIVAAVIVGIWVVMNPGDGLVTRGPITITSNDEFELYSTSGNGTESNPYIIENFRIVLPDGPDQACIYVGDTTAYFIIRYCDVTSLDGKSGIELSYASNGIVMNCNITDGTFGILVRVGDNVAILNNRLEGSYTGLYFLSTTNFVEAGNTFVDCDIETVIVT